MMAMRTGNLNLAASLGYAKLVMTGGTGIVAVDLAVAQPPGIFAQNFAYRRAELQKFFVIPLPRREIPGQHPEQKREQRKHCKDIENSGTGKELYKSK